MHEPTPAPITHACSAQVIAKCETRQSLFNFRALVDASDAIIISRGNLGLDVVRLGVIYLGGRWIHALRRCGEPPVPLMLCSPVPLFLLSTATTQVPEKMAMIQKGCPHPLIHACYPLIFFSCPQVPEKMAMVQKATVSMPLMH